MQNAATVLGVIARNFAQADGGGGPARRPTVRWASRPATAAGLARPGSAGRSVATKSLRLRLTPPPAVQEKGS